MTTIKVESYPTYRLWTITSSNKKREVGFIETTPDGIGVAAYTIGVLLDEIEQLKDHFDSKSSVVDRLYAQSKN